MKVRIGALIIVLVRVFKPLLLKLFFVSVEAKDAMIV